MPNVEPVAVIGRYALYAQIAAGGMATVHIGRLLGPVGFARTVAIKRLHQQYARDPEFVSMFLDEARLAARIRHPNVVPTLDVVALSHELFLVMEYVHGVSLGRLVKAVHKHGVAMPIEIAASIMVGALQGLHAAHEARSERGLPLGIVHRDVSPQNIIVGSDGLARVLDFGVAKATWRLQTTREGQVKGKLAYMAPEQVNGGVLGPWTDVYSAAVVLWELLAGRRLFHKPDGANILLRFANPEPVPRPSELNSAVSVALDAVLLRALETESELRFSSAQEMADAIEALVPLATSSTVRQWVQRMAAEELEQHASLVTEIENGSGSSQHPPSDDSPSLDRLLAAVSDGTSSAARNLPAVHAGEGHASESLRSQISMTRSPTSVAPAASVKPWRRLGVAAALLAAGVSFWALRSHQPATSVHLAGELPSPAFSSPVMASAAASAAVVNAPLASSAPPAVEAPVASSSAAPVRTATNKRATPVTPKVAAAPRASPAAGCNPPYVVDSRGIRHMKLACLR